LSSASVIGADIFLLSRGAWPRALRDYINQIFNTNGTVREDAGRITSTSTAARQIQLGIKAVW
jgi:hypothetical protein